MRGHSGRRLEAGIELLRLLEFEDGGFGVVQAQQSHGQIVMGVRVIGPQANRFAVLIGGECVLTLVEQRISQIEMRISVVWMSRNEFVVGVERPLQIPGSGLHRAQSQHGLGKISLGRERLSESSLGIGELFEGEISVSEIVKRMGIGGLERESFLIRCHCFSNFPLIVDRKSVV